jgi:energy-coupling factor transporter ATP-binding protein EcfA2
MSANIKSLHQHEDAASSWVLRAENIHLGFEGRVVLRGIDLDIRPGTVALLRGPNGAGKTSLIDVLCGIREPDGGLIQLRNGGKVGAIRYPKSFWRSLLQLTNAHPVSTSLATETGALSGTKSLDTSAASKRNLGFGAQPASAPSAPIGSAPQGPGQAQPMLGRAPLNPFMGGVKGAIGLIGPSPLKTGGGFA